MISATGDGGERAGRGGSRRGRRAGRCTRPAAAQGFQDFRDGGLGDAGGLVAMPGEVWTASALRESRTMHDDGVIGEFG